jgi:hypothetical protein
MTTRSRKPPTSTSSAAARAAADTAVRERVCSNRRTSRQHESAREAQWQAIDRVGASAITVLEGPRTPNTRRQQGTAKGSSPGYIF